MRHFEGLNHTAAFEIKGELAGILELCDAGSKKAQRSFDGRACGASQDGCWGSQPPLPN